MKRLSFLATALVGLSMLTSCIKDKCTQTVTYMKDIPVYRSYEEIRQPIKTEAARTLQNPGKIYLYADYVLINELNEGVHVIDNSDPANPQPISFIKIAGNVDIAMKGSVLYADNYTDLLAIDMSNPNSVSVLKRVENIFPILGVNPENSEEVLVRYDQEEVTEELACGEVNNNSWAWSREDITALNSTAAATTGAGRSTGLGGSMARFAINGDYLYTVDNQDLHVLSILRMEDPTEVNRVRLRIDTETLFPYEDKLFVGGNTGMEIYDCVDPTNPVYLSRFEHAFACDPVFVDGNFAYITLRAGNLCRQAWNQLQVVDITNITQPTLVSSYSMENPHGLSVHDDVLYLCEGDFGLKTFDVTDKLNINQNLLSQLDTKAYDVIAVPRTDHILVVGDDGFYQYDTGNPSTLQLISKIEVNK